MWVFNTLLHMTEVTFCYCTYYLVSHSLSWLHTACFKQTNHMTFVLGSYLQPLALCGLITFHSAKKKIDSLSLNYLFSFIFRNFLCCLSCLLKTDQETKQNILVVFKTFKRYGTVSVELFLLSLNELWSTGWTFFPMVITANNNQLFSQVQSQHELIWTKGFSDYWQKQYICNIYHSKTYLVCREAILSWKRNKWKMRRMIIRNYKYFY